MNGLQNKEVRQEYDRMLKVGFRYAGHDAKGHVILEAPSGATVKLSSSPSTFYWRDDFRRAAARALGLNRWQLERKIAGQPIAKATKPRRRQREPRQSRPQLVTASTHPRREAATTGAGVDLRDGAEKSVDEVRANWERAEAERIKRGQRFPWQGAA